MIATAALSLIACTTRVDPERAAAAAPAHAPADAVVFDVAGDAMTNRTSLPDPFDKRVKAVLTLPMAPDVIVAFADIARGKSPALNYRWELHADGRVFVVGNSGKGGDWQVPFDQPLPAKPAQSLPATKVTEVQGWFDDAFFQHPGYEVIGGHDGTWAIARARGNAGVHAVVYENVRTPLLTQLYALVPRPR